jgi:hypothetical protein
MADDPAPLFWPISTFAPLTKPVPATLIRWPPDTGPAFGVTTETVGLGTKTTLMVAVPEPAAWAGVAQRASRQSADIAEVTMRRPGTTDRGTSRLSRSICLMLIDLAMELRRGCLFFFMEANLQSPDFNDGNHVRVVRWPNLGPLGNSCPRQDRRKHARGIGR